MSDKRNYNQIGKDLERTVKESASSGDWSKVGAVIAKSVETVLDDVGVMVSESLDNIDVKSGTSSKYVDGSYTKARMEKLEAERAARNARLAKERREREAMLDERRKQQAKRNEIKRANKQQNYSSSSKGKLLPATVDRQNDTKSTVCSLVGGIGVGVSSVAVISSLPALIAGTVSVGGLLVGGVCVAAFGTVLSRGAFLGSQMKMAKRYALLCGEKGYTEVENIAHSTGQSKKKVIRQIKKLLRKGYYPQGRLDDTCDTLILTDEVYAQYIKTKNSQILDNVIDTTARVVGDDIDGDYPEELKQMISEGTDYINRLHVLNERIPGEVITGKLSRLEVLLREIFARVKEHPEQMSRMHELMDYYLPTMIKLVAAYEEYDKISMPGKDIVDAKNDIENTLDTINVAFNKLLNNLFKDSVWDVTTDAQVLKTMLAQKGLAANTEGEV